MILSRANILLVDDEPLVLEMFESVLSDEGYDVTLASSAQQAIALLDKRSFDVLISDVLLDDMDGFEIQSYAKRKYPDMGVVLITGAPNPIDEQRAFIFGISYLSKPTGFDALLRATEQAIESKSGKIRALA
jgi:DNA-binding NtrC family response regulator